jgi:hypothetical protein
MLPTTLSALDILSPWTAQDARSDLMESQARSRRLCEEAIALRDITAKIRQEAVRLCQSAMQLRIVSAQHRAAGVRRRQQGL